jgi:hypothetical protein
LRTSSRDQENTLSIKLLPSSSSFFFSISSG